MVNILYSYNYKIISRINIYNIIFIVFKLIFSTILFSWQIFSENHVFPLSYIQTKSKKF